MNVHPASSSVLALLPLLCCPGLASAAPPDVDNPAWGCYDAMPKHPSMGEKDAFIAELAPAAVAAEAKGGPPAAGLLAMSALESGFGWTRTAVFANNLFGWKFVSPAAAGGRASWTLQCQPAFDKNKRYIVFRDRTDALSFVAERLRTNDRYRGITARYHADKAAGVDAPDAVGTWVKGIAAAGYNPFPDYPAKVLRLAGNYRHPGSAPSRTVPCCAIPVPAAKPPQPRRRHPPAHMTRPWPCWRNGCPRRATCRPHAIRAR
ncbi:glucosaminidase domain-containing protein [Massilia sp. Dwa41.01b]|uniref:glucosaminidase domain-containing protein n=1 Tax=Massilia sp. Dwa41.01b TaxID=2709302 RepID=UPI001600522F|nr:glucosaminidase domain-containing protein [Massilia sp. Dwa41.01b]QNA89776.1 glucosaminidase domain-containing protein [Massilia sp. Dwa41.01b]